MTIEHHPAAPRRSRADTAQKDAARKWLGKSINRVEDPRFLRGEGRYLDDIKLDGHGARGDRAQPARARAHLSVDTRRPRRCRA